MSEIDTVNSIVNAMYASAGHSPLNPASAKYCGGYLVATEVHIEKKLATIREKHANMLCRAAARVNMKAPSARVTDRIFSVLRAMHARGCEGAFAALVDLAALFSLCRMRTTYRTCAELNIVYDMSLI